MTKIASPAAIGASTGPAAHKREQRDEGDEAAGEGDAEPLGDAEQIAALPGEREAERRQRRHSASSSRPAVMLKNGAPTVILSPVICSSASG